jgi:hypothetical protein
MDLMRLGIGTFTALSAAVVTSVSLAAGGAGSGIRGRVLYGPTCPVARVGQSCTRPYQAWVSVRLERSGLLVTRVRSSVEGYFSVRLRAGEYVLVPQTGRPFPRSERQTVTVRPGRYTSVTVRFDSGIR